MIANPADEMTAAETTKRNRQLEMLRKHTGKSKLALCSVEEIFELAISDWKPGEPSADDFLNTIRGRGEHTE